MRDPKLAELARVAAGLTQGQLAKSLGKTQPFVSQVETGEREIPRDLLNSWATSCEVPPAFFDRAQPPLDDSLSGLIHRRMKTLPVKPFHRANSQVKLRAIEVDALFSEVEVIPALQIPELPLGVGPVDAADTVRRTWRLPNGPISNLTALTESTGIPVLLMHDFHEKQSATSHRGRWFEWLIALNGNHPPSRQRFTLAHELGHIVLRHDSAIAADHQEAQLFEQEADAFAAALLLPRDDARRELRSPSFRRLVALKQRWRVSIAFLIRQALEAGTIDPRERKQLEITLSTQPGGRRREPAEFRSEEPTLLKRMINGLRAEGMDLSEVADLILCTEHTLRHLYLGEPTRLRSVRDDAPRTILKLQHPATWESN